MKQDILFSQNLEAELAQRIDACNPDRVFVLTDTHTQRYCWPRIGGMERLKGAKTITIPAGDANKNLDSLGHVWQQLQQGGATRRSLLVNLGGGMVTDLGGFAASTFKRGIAFINIPTTLLAMVDASAGGKTGVNFNGLKNEIGTFSNARTVLIAVEFLQSLDQENLFSGFAEMLKHSLIASKPMWARHMGFALEELTVPMAPEGLSTLSALITESVAVKERIVDEDPHERGLRKALNLGHTFGHALEEWSFLDNHGSKKEKRDEKKPLLHGYAVAYGLVCELYLSTVKCGFPTEYLRQTARFIRQYYGIPAITCDDYPTLISLMRHDKKNVADTINFTLLSDIGQLQLNQTATNDEIGEALDFLREG